MGRTSLPSLLDTRQNKLKLKTEEQNQRYVNKKLLKAGHGLITDWTPTGKVEARVYEGAWIVDCPRKDCRNAEFADPDWPLFVCRNCRMGPLEVTFPKDRERIEEVLKERPVPQRRNWFPRESLADLKAENKERL